MDVKKLAIIGAIALVVIGCVLAAGCTASVNNQSTNITKSTDGTVTTTTNDNGKVTTQSFNVDDLVGTWKDVENGKTYDTDELITIKCIINKDGTGIRNSFRVSDGKQIQSDNFTWKLDGDAIVASGKANNQDFGFKLKLTSDKKGLEDPSTGKIYLTKE